MVQPLLNISPVAPSHPPKETLPTMYDLPSEDPEEPGLPDDFHYYQPQLLRETFCPPNYPSEQVYIATDLNLYYEINQPYWYKRPDWFAVLGVPRLYQQQDLRMSYVIWQEDVVPFIVIEILSAGTEQEDLGQTLREIHQPPTKWQVYEQILQIPYYVVFSRDPDKLQVFQHSQGQYQTLPIKQGKVWLSEIQLGLGLWLGTYHGLERQWLRWFDAQNHWIPNLMEREHREHQRAEQEYQRAEQERQRTEQERQRAEQEHQRAEQLAAQLRALGIEPDSFK